MSEFFHFVDTAQAAADQAQVPEAAPVAPAPAPAAAPAPAPAQTIAKKSQEEIDKQNRKKMILRIILVLAILALIYGLYCAYQEYKKTSGGGKDVQYYYF